METHSTILSWRIPWTEEPLRLPPMGHKEWTRLTNAFIFTFMAQEARGPKQIWMSRNGANILDITVRNEPQSDLKTKGPAAEYQQLKRERGKKEVEKSK